jgi:hypothetical protein
MSIYNAFVVWIEIWCNISALLQYVSIGGGFHFLEQVFEQLKQVRPEHALIPTSKAFFYTHIGQRYYTWILILIA